MNDDSRSVAPFELRLFGPFGAWVGGEPLPAVRSRKGHWLLALLALRHGGPVERRWLAERLWPDSAPAPAAHSLRATLHDLRRALGAEAARLSSPTLHTLRLDLSGAAVDLLDFDRAIERDDPGALAEAVVLYGGPLLGACDQPWAIDERRAREQALLEALETLAACALESGDLTAAERHLRRAVEIDPLRESACRSLMRVLRAGGNVAAALLVYSAFRGRLFRAWNASPHPETEALFQELQSTARPDGRTKTSQFGREPPGLPAPITRFIGREGEIAAVAQVLSAAHAPGAPRLVTLTGAGGSGKSRLALEIARPLAEITPSGVCWVELAPLIDPAHVPATVAAALGVREEPGRSLLAALIARLRSRGLLLLLDNCEHLVAACASLAQHLLPECPRLCILATSRRPLAIAGEWQLKLPPLPVPGVPALRRSGVPDQTGGSHPSDPSDPSDRSDPPTLNARTPERRNARTPEELLRFEAIQLFVDRAMTALPPFRLSEANAASVVSICQELDGLPLAIELAAARVRLLPVDEIAARLEDRFRLLTRGSPAAPRRHQTLEAAIDWSYHLLSPKEQALLRRLSVFAGGFTAAGAEAVCSGFGLDGQGSSSTKDMKAHEEAPIKADVLPIGSNSCSFVSFVDGPEIQKAEVLDLLAELVEQSLVVVEEHGGQVRHRLLESVREYGRQRLAPEERSAVAERHADYFLSVAQAAHPTQCPHDQMAWLERLDVEHDNMRAALRWSLRPEGSLEIGMRLATALIEFWAPRALQREGREWLEALHQRRSGSPSAVPPAVRAWALHALALMQNHTEPVTARQTLTATRALAEQLGDRVLFAWATLGIGTIWLELNEWEKARQCQEESLAIFREHGERRGLAWALAFLGTTEHRAMRGEAKARALLEESLRVSDEIGDLSAPSQALPVLGELAHACGDFKTARAYQERALRLYQAQGGRLGVAGSLGRLARLTHEEGDDETAIRLVHQALAIHRQMEQDWQVTSGFSLLGDIEYRQGKIAQAAARHEEVLEAWRRLGFEGGMVWSLSLLGEIARRDGRSARARTCLREAWTIWRDWEERWRADVRRHEAHGWRLGSLLLNLGWGAAAEGDREAARALTEESLARREAAGDAAGALECRDALAALAAEAHAVQAGDCLGPAELPDVVPGFFGSADERDHSSLPAARLSWTPEPPLALTLFGPFEARRRGDLLHVARSRKGFRLLALLVLRHRSPVERTWLAGTLWPECPDPQALANLRNTLTDLRRALGSEGERFRSPTRHTLALDLAGAAVDVITFDQAMKRRDPISLEHAIGLYRGPLLESWTDDWAFQERLAREQEYLDALEALAAWWQQQGDWKQAERCLRQAITVEPTRETAQRALMTAMAAGGDPAAAVQTYHELCRLLQDLGLTPARETIRLFNEIRAGIR